MEFLLFIFVAVVLAAWWFKFRLGRKAKSTSNTVAASPLSEQELTQLQMDFENRLTNDCDLPGGIRGRDAYIYWNLMRNWFEKLIATNRYDDEYAKKLRHDWCDYIQLLPQAKTALFMAREINDETKVAAYEQKAESASRSIERIQNAFAAAFGAEAIEQLSEVRSKNANAFDRSGRKPMAPEGYHYFPVSINPYIEECQLKASHAVAP